MDDIPKRALMNDEVLMYHTRYTHRAVLCTSTQYSAPPHCAEESHQIITRESNITETQYLHASIW